MRTFLTCTLLAAVACGETTDSSSSDTPTPQRAVVRVVADGYYAGTWTAGTVDYSRPCAVETGGGVDYTACCPAGFSPVGFANNDHSAPDENVVYCLEDAPASGRTVVTVGDRGTWDGGVYYPEDCATNAVVDVVDGDNTYEGDPPDDFSACCPVGFEAVGFATRSAVTDIACVER